ncbi:ATP-grasp domain-containing protein [Legionella septentrionalis]|uniref:ATP-grasp domain-containing protein n=1 Tax=Legionella septentrionalis TaxID=2498109 RepID=UPI000F8DCB62|nr:ATP-grasp domain-containing protein [Legionella septentrionalis]RUR09310.1 ATP-grasp domain-containing protein [Legionella septentrionalis]RUR17111.1 ATP-grasp domain-containing protein [Legionella septentrionalis]
MKILITGAGGAAAVSVWKSLSQLHELVMADIDPCAAGLYLVPAKNRVIIPAGKDPGFASTLLKLCLQHSIELLIPTVDAELSHIAKHKADFTAAGIKIPLSPLPCLELCRDKYKLLNFCKETGVTPAFQLYDEGFNASQFNFPCFAKPRMGAGSHGATMIANPSALNRLPKDGSYIIQELLPGDEYSVDVYVSTTGHVLAAVPRLRMKIDSGIAVASQTKNNPELIEKALNIAQKTGITYVANIQFKANASKEFKLLEINPRFPGTLPLTAAAGIDIPKLLIDDLLGKPLGASLLPFRELMVVRYWTEHFFAIDEWKALCQI